MQALFKPLNAIVAVMFKGILGGCSQAGPYDDERR